MASTSAIGRASHAPSKAGFQILGSVKSSVNAKTIVLISDIKPDTKPSLNAVNHAVAKKLNPINRNPNVMIRKPRTAMPCKCPINGSVGDT